MSALLASMDSVVKSSAASASAPASAPVSPHIARIEAARERWAVAIDDQGTPVTEQLVRKVMAYGNIFIWECFVEQQTFSWQFKALNELFEQVKKADKEGSESQEVISRAQFISTAQIDVTVCQTFALQLESRDISKENAESISKFIDRFDQREGVTDVQRHLMLKIFRFQLNYLQN